MMKSYRMLAKFLPYSYMWLLYHSIGEAKTILDLGCSDGELMKTLYNGSWKITGVDIFPQDVKKAQLTGVYQEVIRGDVEKVSRELIKKKTKYDVVFFSQVIEHISKKKGERMLDLIEKLAKKRIIVGTPRGFMVQPEVFIGDNPHQHHHSGWEIVDFTRRNYQVNGVGWNFIWSESGIGRNQNPLTQLLSMALSYFSSPFAYFLQQYAAGILAVKEKR